MMDVFKGVSFKQFNDTKYSISQSITIEWVIDW